MGRREKEEAKGCEDRRKVVMNVEKECRYAYTYAYPDG